MLAAGVRGTDRTYNTLVKACTASSTRNYSGFIAVDSFQWINAQSVSHDVGQSFSAMTVVILTFIYCLVQAFAYAAERAAPTGGGRAGQRN